MANRYPEFTPDSEPRKMGWKKQARAKTYKAGLASGTEHRGAEAHVREELKGLRSTRARLGVYRLEAALRQIHVTTWQWSTSGQTNEPYPCRTETAGSLYEAKTFGVTGFVYYYFPPHYRHTVRDAVYDNGTWEHCFKWIFLL